MPLSSEKIDWIHARLGVRYGDAWRKKWDGIPDEVLKADWAQALDGVEPFAIHYAMNHLPPSFPPTAGQFREISVQAPTPAQPQLPNMPEVKADPERVRRMLAEAMSSIQKRDKLQWAKDLKAHEEASGPASLTDWQRWAWRAALEAQPTGQMRSTDFTPIPTSMLPPGMREALRKGEMHYCLPLEAEPGDDFPPYEGNHDDEA